MRTTITAVIACACPTMTHAGELIVEPDHFIRNRTAVSMFDGNIQSQFVDIGVPVFGRRIQESWRSSIGQGPNPSSVAWDRIEYLLTRDIPGVPIARTDRIFIGALARTESGNSSAGLDRSALVHLNTYTQFYLTESAVVDLSGFINLELSDLVSGGNRFAHASINIARLDNGLPESILVLNEYNENIPNSIDWTSFLEPGHYSFSVGLVSSSSAGAPGDSAVSDISTNLELTFAAIPAPASTGLVGVMGLFAARRRR
ncbi:MAG: hypothetical protein ACIAQF_03400 [Phycisphaerales bacterium JB065]